MHFLLKLRNLSVAPFIRTPQVSNLPAGTQPKLRVSMLLAH